MFKEIFFEHLNLNVPKYFFFSCAQRWWLGAIYADWPYGFDSASWDAEFPSSNSLATFFNGVTAMNTATEVFAFCWVPSSQAGEMRKVLTKAGFTNLQDLFWWKQDLTRVGPMHMMVEAVEMCVVGMKDYAPKGVAKLSMPTDPRLRHNIVIGPALTSYAMHPTDKTPINVREKPEYLAHKIVDPYLQPLDWVMVPCAGACGDVRGLLNRGLNVVAIEKDPRQFEACLALFNAWQPEPQNIRGAIPLHALREAVQLVRADPLAHVVPEVEHVPETMNCDACNNDFDARQSTPCERCGKCFFCFDCSAAGCKVCHDCQVLEAARIELT